MFLSLKVERMVGFSQSIEPSLHRRACLEMPEIVSSDLDDVTSERCWPIRVRKLTRVWPTYFALSLQLHVCKYTPFWSSLFGRVLLALHKMFPSLGPGFE